MCNKYVQVLAHSIKYTGTTFHVRIKRPRRKFDSLVATCEGQSGTAIGALRTLQIPCHSFIAPIAP
jgi:hypothetical protein